MAYFGSIKVRADDSPSVDAFSRWRVSSPQGLFDAQLTYDLQPLLFEQVTSGSGATVAHDATNRCALMTFSSTPAGGLAYMQSYEWVRYQPGKSQLAFISFNFIETAANCVKFVGLSAGATNGFELQQSGSTVQFVLYSDTGNGDQTVTKSNWNLDTLDGSGSAANPSGLTLNLTKIQILALDFQALYSGRVRMGFDLNGEVVWAHEFNFANSITVPYIQTATLPVRCGMSCSDAVSTTMRFTCSSVSSEGGQENEAGYTFSSGTTVISAGNGTATHFISVRPQTTFNSIANRTKFILESLDLLVTGNYPVKWELCLGQAITSTSYTSANATYSAFEVGTGTISGSPAIVMSEGYVPASATVKSSINVKLANRYPITLNTTGAVRALGTLSLVCTGLGGGSNTYASLNWRELR